MTEKREKARGKVGSGKEFMESILKRLDEIEKRLAEAEKMLAERKIERLPSIKIKQNAYENLDDQNDPRCWSFRCNSQQEIQ